MEGLILWEINTQPRRFGELKRLLPLVSEKMLTQHLRELERDGILHREMFPEVPPRVEYSVTKLARNSSRRSVPCDWGEKHMTRIQAIREPQV